MWIEIKKDVFEEADFKSLNFILQLLSWYPSDSLRRYKIKINTEQVNDTSNYNKLTEIDKELIQNEFNDAVTIGIKTGNYIISNNNSAENTFNIEEAIRFFNQPLFIVLENSLNDAYFLKALFTFFDKKNEDQKRKLNEFLRNGWIQIVNAGGWTNIRNYIRGQLNNYESIAAINLKEPWQYFRCFVMIDSDKEYPSDDKPDRRQLKSDLEAQKITVHILQKRAMENYMPDEVIESLPNIYRKNSQIRTWSNVYSKLNKDQKNFLSYQRGFPKTKSNGKSVCKNRIQQMFEIQKLYANLTENDYKIIDLGLQEFPDFKDNFSALFENNHLVNSKSLLKREGGKDTNNEFLEILQKINALL